ncbi:hypothetical protein RvY_06511 [Ramazzottius varieornatus]|uniref:Aminoacyl-transfer RNA synthetases class-II family profile domain-containing protein n=1 Tax=Ramazzottius varieornatus TaxID=947166 RepID=A0A1D1UYV5_RAMVA|nr:hypothetical protein RvY_06511 [Ramazzottius varieornatus]
MTLRAARFNLRHVPRRCAPPDQLRCVRSAHFARMTGIFQPFVVTPHNQGKNEDAEYVLSRSQKLLISSGMISPASSAGTFHLLPMLTRSLEKLTKIIDQELKAVGCQKLTMPALQDASIWKSSGRWKGMGSEMLKFKDRLDRECCLGPTHEEAITRLVATSLHRASYKKFPLRLYQVGKL